MKRDSSWFEQTIQPLNQTTAPWDPGMTTVLEMDVSKNRGKTPQKGWFIMENPIKMDDLGVPLFLETPRYSLHNHHEDHHP